MLRVPVWYIFTCTVPWKKGGSWQCQHCDLFSILLVFQCVVRKIRWLSLHLLPHLKSCIVQVPVWHIGRRKYWDWSDEENLPRGLVVHTEGPHALVDLQSDDLRSYEAIFNRTAMLCCTKVVFLFFFKRRVFRLLKIFSDVSSFV